MKNILEKTRAYLIGAIEDSSDYGYGWRCEVKTRLELEDIIVFDPTKKPYVKDMDETEEMQLYVKKLRAENNYDELSHVMKEIRAYDLALVDKSDFIVFYFDPDCMTCGSWEEFFWANREKKPIFFICEKGFHRIPLWVFGTIPFKYMYLSVDSFIDMIYSINSGETTIDSTRWRLLSKEYR